MTAKRSRGDGSRGRDDWGGAEDRVSHGGRGIVGVGGAGRGRAGITYCNQY